MTTNGPCPRRFEHVAGSEIVCFGDLSRPAPLAHGACDVTGVDGSDVRLEQPLGRRTIRSGAGGSAPATPEQQERTDHTHDRSPTSHDQSLPVVVHSDQELLAVADAAVVAHRDPLSHSIVRRVTTNLLPLRAVGGALRRHQPGARYLEVPCRPPLGVVGRRLIAVATRAFVLMLWAARRQASGSFTVLLAGTTSIAGILDLSSLPGTWPLPARRTLGSPINRRMPVTVSAGGGLRPAPHLRPGQWALR